ncbi:MAG: hypothetical protein WCG86_04310 [Actinomycetota bacterium]|jgi:hypothetical protein
MIERGFLRPALLWPSTPRLCVLALSGLAGCAALVGGGWWLCVCCLSGALFPLRAGSAGADHLVLMWRYFGRSRWTRWSQTGVTTITVSCRGRRELSAFEYPLRGTAEFSALRGHITHSLAHFSQQLALADQPSHFTLTWWRDGERPRFVLLSSAATAPPSPWRELALEVPHRRSEWALERPGHIRLCGGVIRVVRVVTVDRAANWNESLARYASSRQVSVNCEVQPQARARRRTSREAHRSDTDAVLLERAGFRPSLRQRDQGEGWRWREAALSQGSALTRITIAVLLRAESPRELRQQEELLRADARRGGVTLAFGRWQQLGWWREQLPTLLS